MLFYLMLTHRYLKLSSINFLFFFALFGCISLVALSSRSLIFSLLHLVFYWTPLVYVSVWLLYSSALWPLFCIYIFYLFNISTEVLTVFIHSFPKFNYNLYYHYFQFFIKHWNLMDCWLPVSPLQTKNLTKDSMHVLVHTHTNTYIAKEEKLGLVLAN